MELTSSTENIRLLVFTAWFSEQSGLNFYEKKVLLEIIKNKGKRLGIEHDFNLLGQDYHLLLRNIIKKVSDLLRPGDLESSEEEVLVSFLISKYLTFCELIGFEEGFQDKVYPSTLSGGWIYDTTISSEDNAQVKHSLESKLRIIKCRFHSLKLYESFIRSLESNDSINANIKKLAKYICRFTEDSSEASEAISLLFLGGLPRLIRRMAATSNYGISNIEALLEKEIELNLLSLVGAYGISDVDAQPLLCFAERYIRLLKIPKSYTADGVVADAVQRASIREYDSIDQHIAAARLEMYSTFNLFYQGGCGFYQDTAASLSAVKSSVLKNLERRFKASASPFIDQPYENSLDQKYLRHIDFTASIFKRVQDYLDLVTNASLEKAQLDYLHKILESSIQNEVLSLWIARVDCLLLENLVRKIHKIEEENGESQFRETSFWEALFNIKVSHHMDSKIVVFMGLVLSPIILSYLFIDRPMANLIRPATPIKEDVKSDFTSSSATHNLGNIKAKLRQINANVTNEKIYENKLQSYMPQYVSAVGDSDEVGLATWSGSESQNKLTASGEAFDRHKLTASHPDLPFNSRVKVTNLSTSQEIIVEINDRIKSGGPVINVSEAAAQALDMIDVGQQKVSLDILCQDCTE